MLKSNGVCRNLQNYIEIMRNKRKATDSAPLKTIQYIKKTLHNFKQQNTTIQNAMKLYTTSLNFTKLQETQHNFT